MSQVRDGARQRAGPPCSGHAARHEARLIDFDAEKDMKEQRGVRVAASRKLEHELGIPQRQTPIDHFQYLTRIHYLAPSNGLWGEHEGERMSSL